MTRKQEVDRLEWKRIRKSHWQNIIYGESHSVKLQQQKHQHHQPQQHHTERWESHIETQIKTIYKKVTDIVNNLGQYLQHSSTYVDT